MSTKFSTQDYTSTSYLISLYTFVTINVYRNKQISNIWLYVLAVLGFIGAILCQQRIAMACSVLVLIFFAVWGVKKGNKTFLILTSVVVVAFFAFISFLQFEDRISIINDMLTQRLDEMNFSYAMSQRTGQYESASEEIMRYILTGKGMGAGGHSATLYGGIGVHDGEYFHMLLEFGIIGCSLLLFIIIATLKRAFQHFTAFIIEFCVIVYFLLCGVGENVLSQSYLIGPIFWFCIGRVWNNSYLNRRLYEQ